MAGNIANVQSNPIQIGNNEHIVITIIGTHQDDEHIKIDDIIKLHSNSGIDMHT